MLPPSFYKEENMNAEKITDITMNFNNPKWILEHITIALQRTSNESIMKRPCDLDGIEQYLILKGEQDGANYSVKAVPVLLSNVGIEENYAWDRALENFSAETQITSLGKVLSDLMGAPYDSSMDSDVKFHVITNTQKFKGAAAIMNRKALRTFTQKYSTNMLFVLPSSIHEMMIAPYDSNLHLDDLSAMVKEINETQVAPEERLTDRAYIITI